MAVEAWSRDRGSWSKTRPRQTQSRSIASRVRTGQIRPRLASRAQDISHSKLWFERTSMPNMDGNIGLDDPAANENPIQSSIQSSRARLVLLSLRVVLGTETSRQNVTNKITAHLSFSIHSSSHKCIIHQNARSRVVPIMPSSKKRQIRRGVSTWSTPSNLLKSAPGSRKTATW